MAINANPPAVGAVLVLGEALLDVVEEADEVVEYVGGSPANVAFGLGRLDHDTMLATWIGEDDRGRRILDACTDSGVRLVPGSTGAARTSVANATIDADGQANYDFDLTWELPDLPKLATAAHLHTGSIAGTLEPGGAQVVSALRSARETATVSYDPNARPTLMGTPEQARLRIEEIIALSDVVKASDEDIAWLYAGRELGAVVDEWLALGPQLVVVTRGGDGASFALRSGEHGTVGAATVSLVDTVGAGDSFMAGLLSGLLDAGLLGTASARARLVDATARDVQPALERAVATSGLTVGVAGAYAPTRHELR